METTALRSSRLRPTPWIGYTSSVMARTALRPIPRGRVSQAEALAFGVVLAGCAVATLGVALNIKAALLAFTIFFYIVAKGSVPGSSSLNTPLSRAASGSAQTESQSCRVWTTSTSVIARANEV